MRKYRITADQYPWNGLTFEVEDDATDEQVAEEAFQVVIEHVDYGWEPVEE